MSARQVAVPAFVASVLAAVLQLLQQYGAIVARDAGLLPLWSVASLFASLLILVLNPGVVVAGSYWVGRRVDVPTAWPAVTGWALVGSVVGYVVGGATAAVGVLALAGIGELAGAVVISTGFNALGGTVHATIAALAGASVGAFSQ